LKQLSEKDKLSTGRTILKKIFLVDIDLAVYLIT